MKNWKGRSKEYAEGKPDEEAIVRGWRNVSAAFEELRSEVAGEADEPFVARVMAEVRESAKKGEEEVNFWWSLLDFSREWGLQAVAAAVSCIVISGHLLSGPVVDSETVLIAGYNAEYELTSSGDELDPLGVLGFQWGNSL